MKRKTHDVKEEKRGKKIPCKIQRKKEKERKKRRWKGSRVRPRLKREKGPEERGVKSEHPEALRGPVLEGKFGERA